MAQKKSGSAAVHGHNASVYSRMHKRATDPRFSGSTKFSSQRGDEAGATTTASSYVDNSQSKRMKAALERMKESNKLALDLESYQKSPAKWLFKQPKHINRLNRNYVDTEYENTKANGFHAAITSERIKEQEIKHRQVEKYKTEPYTESQLAIINAN